MQCPSCSIDMNPVELIYAATGKADKTTQAWECEGCGNVWAINVNGALVVMATEDDYDPEDDDQDTRMLGGSWEDFNYG